MATLFCCGAYRKVASKRLISKDSNFKYQRLYILESCPKCSKKTMQWRGEDHAGDLSDFYDIDVHAYAQWERRVKTEEENPELQMMSEYSERIGRPADLAGYYHNTLQLAKRWWKGERIG